MLVLIIPDYSFLINFTVNKKHHRLNLQLNKKKKKFGGPVKHNLPSEWIVFQKELCVLPWFDSTQYFFRGLNDGTAEGLQIFCHRFQDNKEGYMTAAIQTPTAIVEGAKDCSILARPIQLRFKTLLQHT